VNINRRQTFSFTTQHRGTGSSFLKPSRDFRITLKILPIVLVLLIGVAIGLTKGPSGLAGRVINDMGGEHKKILEDAYSQIVSGDFNRAAATASSVIRVDPGNALAYHLLGLADARRGLTEEAAASFGKAVELDPSFKLAWFNLGVVDESRGEFARALAEYRKTAELEPDNRGYADAADRMQRIVIGEGEWDWREKEAEKEILDGVEALGRGGPDDLAYAESTFRSLVEERPYDVAARNMLGLTLAREGKVDEAEQVFLDVVKAEPGYADAWYNLGMVHQAQGKLDDAMKDFQSAKAAGGQASFQLAVDRQIAIITDALADAAADSSQSEAYQLSGQAPE